MGLLRNLEIMLGGVVTQKVSGRLFDWIEAISQLLDGEGGPAGGVSLGAAFGLTQATWFVDPVNGNDANNGATAATALKTDARRQVLWGGTTQALILQPVTVTYLSALPATDIVNYNVTIGSVGGVSGKLFITSPMNQQVGAGTGAFTAVQAINRAGNLVSNVTDGARAWTRGQRIRIMSGARVGAVAWITKDLGAGVAETTAFFTYPAGGTNAFPTAVTPQVGDPYVTETLNTIPIGRWEVHTTGPSTATTGAMFIDQMDVDGTAFGAQGSMYTDSEEPGIVGTSCNFKACALIGINNDLAIQLTNCLADTLNVTGVAFLGGGCHGGAVSNVFPLPNGIVIFDRDFLGADQPIITTATGPSAVIFGNVAAMRASVAVDLNPGAIARQFNIFGAGNALYGSGNGIGVRARSMAAYIYASGSKPTIATTTSDAVVGGTNKAWAAIPYVEAANQAEIVVYA
jgi:hypothetical protein